MWEFDSYPSGWCLNAAEFSNASRAALRCWMSEQPDRGFWGQLTPAETTSVLDYVGPMSGKTHFKTNYPNVNNCFAGARGSCHRWWQIGHRHKRCQKAWGWLAKRQAKGRLIFSVIIKDLVLERANEALTGGPVDDLDSFRRTPMDICVSEPAPRHPH